MEERGWGQRIVDWWRGKEPDQAVARRIISPEERGGFRGARAPYTESTPQQEQRQPERPSLPREAGREAAVEVHQWLEKRHLETYWALDRKDVANIAMAAWREGALAPEARHALGRELAQEPPGKLVEVGRIIEAAAGAAWRAAAEERTPGEGHEVGARRQQDRDDYEARGKERQAVRERGWGQSWEEQRAQERER